MDNVFNITEQTKDQIKKRYPDIINGKYKKEISEIAQILEKELGIE